MTGIFEPVCCLAANYPGTVACRRFDGQCRWSWRACVRCCCDRFDAKNDPWSTVDDRRTRQDHRQRTGEFLDWLADRNRFWRADGSWCSASVPFAERPFVERPSAGQPFADSSDYRSATDRRGNRAADVYCFAFDSFDSSDCSDRSTQNWWPAVGRTSSSRCASDTVCLHHRISPTTGPDSGRTVVRTVSRCWGNCKHSVWWREIALRVALFLITNSESSNTHLMTDFRCQHKSITEQLHTVKQCQTVGDRFGIFEFHVRELIFEDDPPDWSTLWWEMVEYDEKGIIWEYRWYRR